MSFVLDGSLVLAWCLPDERTDATQALRVMAGAEGAEVPAIWQHEVANGFLMAIRRGRLLVATATGLLRELRDMDIVVDVLGGSLVWSATFQLAQEHRLTAYDASYLELALRRRLPLATLDQALARAAQAEGITTLP